MANKLLLNFSIQFYASIFLVFIPFVILYKTSRLQTLIKFFVLLDRPDNKVIDKTSGYRKSQNKNGNTSKFFVGFHRIKKFSSPKIKIWFEPMFFSGFFCGFQLCGSPPFRIFAGGFFRKNAFGLIQEYCTRKEKSKSFGSMVSPPATHFFLIFLGKRK